MTFNNRLFSAATLLALAHLRGGYAWGTSNYGNGNYGNGNYGNSNGNSQRIPMNSIDTLTFHQGRQTNSRRVSAVPQLKCIGGDGKYEANQNVNVVQCRKVGSGYGNDIQWKCESNLPLSLKLGETTVSCEGYEHSSDPYVLQGSCGLEYTLHKTGISPRGGGYNSAYNSGGKSSGSFFSYLMLGFLGYAFLGSSMFFWGVIAFGASSIFGLSMSSLVFIALLMWMLSPRSSSRNYTEAAGSHYHSNAGWGSGWGNSWGSGWGGSPFGTSYGYGHPGYSHSSSPGFFSGVAAGGLASSMFNAPSHRNYNYNRGSSSRTYGSGTSGRSTHTSTGFGGTRNR